MNYRATYCSVSGDLYRYQLVSNADPLTWSEAQRNLSALLWLDGVRLPYWFAFVRIEGESTRPGYWGVVHGKPYGPDGEFVHDFDTFEELVTYVNASRYL